MRPCPPINEPIGNDTSPAVMLSPKARKRVLERVGSLVTLTANEQVPVRLNESVAVQLTERTSAHVKRRLETGILAVFVLVKVQILSMPDSVSLADALVAEHQVDREHGNRGRAHALEAAI